MPTGEFNICWPRDCVSRHNGGTAGAPIMPPLCQNATVGTNGLIPNYITKWKIQNSIISQKLRIAKKNSWIQKLRSEYFGSFEINIIFYLNCTQNTWKLWTKSVITRKKNRNFFSFLIRFSTIGPKNRNRFFWGGVCISFKSQTYSVGHMYLAFLWPDSQCPQIVKHG